MENYRWAETFREIYDHAVKAYRSGKRKPNDLVSGEQKKFLESIGCTPQELFDFVEDFCRDGEPLYDDVLLVTAVRRDYFLTVQKGNHSGQVVDMDRLPPKDEPLAGIAWLPRLIEKAKAKLRGEMPPELMYGCGGDRPFLRSVNVHLADFLRVAWAAGDDRDAVVKYVKESRAKK